MSKWETGIITDAGTGLLTRAEKGEKMTLTRVALGDGSLGSANPAALKSLVRQTVSLAILESKRASNNTLHIRADVDQEKVTADFWWRETGVFAKGEDNAEVLYAYFYAGTNVSYVNKSAVDVISIKIPVVIGGAQNVAVTLDKSVAYVTLGAMAAHRHDGADAPHIAYGDLTGTPAQLRPLTLTLPASKWVNNLQTVAADGVLADSLVFPSYAPEHKSAWQQAGIDLAAQHNGMLVFRSEWKPDADINANIAYTHRPPITATGPVAVLEDVPAKAEVSATARVIAAQSGAGDPTPDSRRPITGKNAVNATRDGKNLYNRNIVTFGNNPAGTTHTIADGVIRVVPNPTTSAGIFISQANAIKWFSHLVGQSFVYSFEARADASITLQASFLNSVRTNFNITTEWARCSVPVASLVEISTTVSAFYMPSGNASSTPFEIRNIQVELGSAATAYESYTGNAYAVASPALLYGWDAAAPATVDIAAGAISDPANVRSLTGAEAWSVDTQGNQNTTIAFFLSDATVQAGSLANCKSDQFKLLPSATSDEEGIRSGFGAGGIGIRINRSRLATQDVAGFKAWLVAQNPPVQAWYKLAAPRTFAITSLYIPALPGLNQVYTDGGGDTSAFA